MRTRPPPLSTCAATSATVLSDLGFTSTVRAHARRPTTSRITRRAPRSFDSTRMRRGTATIGTSDVPARPTVRATAGGTRAKSAGQLASKERASMGVWRASRMVALFSTQNHHRPPSRLQTPPLAAPRPLLLDLGAQPPHELGRVERKLILGFRRQIPHGRGGATTCCPASILVCGRKLFIVR